MVVLSTSPGNRSYYYWWIRGILSHSPPSPRVPRFFNHRSCSSTLAGVGEVEDTAFPDIVPIWMSASSEPQRKPHGASRMLCGFRGRAPIGTYTRRGTVTKTETDSEPRPRNLKIAEVVWDCSYYSYDTHHRGRFGDKTCSPRVIAAHSGGGSPLS